MVATGTMAAGPDAATSNMIADLMLKMEGWIFLTSGTCFALGSTIYCYLFLRARSIPVPLAWLGVLASILVLVVVPLQLAGFMDASVTCRLDTYARVRGVVCALAAHQRSGRATTDKIEV